MRALAVLAALAALAVAACGGGEESRGPQAAPSAGQPIPGGGLSVREAIASELDGPLAVAGNLVQRDGELRLCSAVLESEPPRCGEPSLRVEGYTEPYEPGERVSLLGEVADGAIRVSATSR